MLDLSKYKPKGYYRFPTINQDSIVFTAEGDLWKCSQNGGIAQRITSHPGTKYGAKFSYCGKYLAFTGQYEGVNEVYVMDVEGGLPKRLTYSVDGSKMINWTFDGKIIYASRKCTGLPNLRLFVIDPYTLEEKPIQLHQASDGCYDENGSLFFTRLPFQGSHTKRYRGGYIENLWRFNGDCEAVFLEGDFKGTSKNPIYYKERVYFISDRDLTMNLWSMDKDGSNLKQHTFYKNFDIKSASLNCGKIVFHKGADIYIYDIEKDKSFLVDISLRSDFDHTRERWINNPLDFLSSYCLSSDGQKLLLTSRGRIFSAPSKQGRILQVAGKDGVRYKNAFFVHGEQDIIALSDERGEFEYQKISLLELDKTTSMTENSKVINLGGEVSPNGKKFIYGDKNRRVWLLDLCPADKIGLPQEIFRSDYYEIDSFSWSPDSRYIAFSAVKEDNLMQQIYVYDTYEKILLPVTGNRYDSYSPCWSSDGKWLYFISDRNFKSIVSSPWGARQVEPYFPKVGKIYALDLVGMQRFPFWEKDELCPDDEKSSDNLEKNQTEDKEVDIPEIIINFQGIMERIVETPIPAGNYHNLSLSSDCILFLEYQGENVFINSLKSVKISNEPLEVVTIIDNIESYQLSGNLKKVVFKQGQDFYVIPSDSKKIDKLGKFRINLDKWTFSVDPRKEWKQMFIDAWRMERDYFYDIGLHGVDYQKLLELHLPLVDRVTDRQELNDLISSIVGELSALHTFVVGGDVRKSMDNIQIGCLGAELQYRSSSWYINHIYQTDPDHPSVKSPLLRNDLDIRDGDIIQKIDGVLLSGNINPYKVLRNKINTQVLLTIQRKREIFDVIIKTISPYFEYYMRYSEWEYKNRLIVENKSKNNIGYVHLRAMGNNDYSDWVHNFYPVFDRKGLVIDVRNNGGGNIDSWILERLLRKAWFYWQSRDGKPIWNMQYAFRGHIVVLCNEQTASDGEAFSEGIRRLNIGTIIGRRTWGGEIWLSFNNTLVDNGIASAAQMGVYGEEGKWLIEGEGVIPDIEVDNLPYQTYKGEDKQLDVAINFLLEKIDKEPRDVPVVPKFPLKTDQN